MPVREMTDQGADDRRLVREIRRLRRLGRRYKPGHRTHVPKSKLSWGRRPWRRKR